MSIFIKLSEVDIRRAFSMFEKQGDISLHEAIAEIIQKKSIKEITKLLQF